MADTTYIVLRYMDYGDGSTERAKWAWEQVGDAVNAANAQAAIRADLSGLLPGDPSHAGTYVAVPVRSWKPVTVTAVQQTVLKIEEAG